MVKRLLSFTLVITIILSLTSCGGTSANNTTEPTSAPATAQNNSSIESDTSPNQELSSEETPNDEPVPISFFRVAVQQNPQEDRLLLELQKRTNTKLTIITAPWDQEGAKVMTMLSSGDKVDIISLAVGQVNYPELCRDGMFYQLDDLLATGLYPIEKKLAYADIYYKKYNVDGKVYGIPLPIQPGDQNNIIRSDWLEAVGLDMPKTPDDMYEVMKAFKENDPDGNGVDDTLGRYVSFANHGLYAIFNMFMCAFNGFDMIDGKIAYNFSSPKYYKALKYTQRLYNEGLINSDFATIKDYDYILNQFCAGRAGMGESPMIVSSLESLRQLEPDAQIELLVPLPHDDGTNGANCNDSSWDWMLNVLPITGSNPEKAMEFLEYCNSEEGRKLLCVGIEGIHYESYKDGVFYGLNQEEQDKDWDREKGEGPTGSPIWWGMTSTINGVIPFDKYDTVEEALRNPITFVKAEDKESNPYWDMRRIGSEISYHNPIPVGIPEMQEIQGDVNSLLEEFSCKMIIAPDDAAFDALWDEYLTRLDNYGMGEAVSAAQAWYDANN